VATIWTSLMAGGSWETLAHTPESWGRRDLRVQRHPIRTTADTRGGQSWQHLTAHISADRAGADRNDVRP
jgi:hypothetical protein